MIQPRLVFGAAGSTTKSRVTPGHPEICCTFCPGQEMPRFIPRGSATPVDDCKESRMRFVDPTKPYRKSGGMGHPGVVARKSNGMQSSSSQVHWREPENPPPGLGGERSKLTHYRLSSSLPPLTAAVHLVIFRRFRISRYCACSIDVRRRGLDGNPRPEHAAAGRV
jgi:hypothetical protein